MSNTPDCIHAPNGEKYSLGSAGYPFFLYEGQFFLSAEHQGHGRFAPVVAQRLGLDESYYKRINDREHQTTGRIYPRLDGFGGKTVITVWKVASKSKDTIRCIADEVMAHYGLGEEEVLIVAPHSRVVALSEYLVSL